MARSFDDGSSEYLQGSFSLSGEPYTLAAWCYTDDVTINQIPLSIGDDASIDYAAIQIRGGDAGDSVWNVVLQGGSRNEAISTAGVSVNTWHHICGVTAAANDRAVFLDGGNKGTDATARAVGTINRASVGVSADNTPFGYFSGRVAEAAVWNVALTDAEVAVLANGTCPLLVRTANLVSYWPLIGVEDLDWVGGYNLTAYNTPSVAAHPPAVMHRARGPAVVYQVPAIY